MDQNEEREHKVYGSEIPDEGEMDVEMDMSARAEEDDGHQAPNSMDLEDMNKRLEEIEEEGGALCEMQAKVENEMGNVQEKTKGRSRSKTSSSAGLAGDAWKTVFLGYLFGEKTKVAYISDVSRFPASKEYVISKSGASQFDLLILDTLYKYDPNGVGNEDF